MNSFPGQFTILRPDAWSAGNAAGKYAGQPLKASCASCAEGLATLLCAPSQISELSHLLRPVHQSDPFRGQKHQTDRLVHPNGTFRGQMPQSCSRVHRNPCFHGQDRPTGAYVPPTTPSVATLILTLGGKTDRRATKQACKVLPVVNTSSIRSRCFMPVREETLSMIS